MKPKFLIFLICLFSSPLYAQAIKNREIVGNWEVWIPGAVTYLAKDDALYRQYTPGAWMHRLQIRADGSFKWGDHEGKLERVKPWHAEDHQVYYRIADKRNNTYDFRYKKETDQLIILFGEVGGHAATGTRMADQKDNPVAGKAATFNVNDEVEILWSGVWYKGTILEIREGKYKVHYTGWSSQYDEWVPASRLKK